ncbi:ABC transporter substrate-binding protein [Longirhabdus pacifica]|uniref:ABC transporter substrate-binding protein n=1 Tax=Longirhabdus pacifica TaxID=2305227 RepID=UPI001008BCB0|nr:ABC transporter substrate-binding protein [Longirhabdus pacifica]
MKSLDYFKMRAHLYPREVNLNVEFTLQEMENIWYCNRKSVKEKIKKFENEGKYTYLPGRGRGHFSRLHFSTPLQEEIEETVLYCLEEEHMEDVFQLLRLPIPHAWITNLSKEIRSFLGFQTNEYEKEILRLTVAKRIVTLDPTASAINFEYYLLQQLGNTLVSYNQETDTVVPQLAHCWKAENNHQTWTFYLRKGVQFHHQRMLHSEDVKYTLERFIQQSTSKHWLIKDILTIECLSSHHIRIQLSRPHPLFLRYMSLPALTILPSDVPFQEDKFIGTGPFFLKKRSDSVLVIEAFDSYFRERPLIDEIEFYFLATNTLLTSSIEVKGETVHKPRQKKEDVLVGFRFLIFNFNRQSIIQNSDFRCALFHLLDMKQMWSDLGRENVVESSSLFPWKSVSKVRDKTLVPTLLEKSGYQGETLTIYTKNIFEDLEVTNWIIKEAHSFGIYFRCITFNMDDFYSSQLEEQADVLFASEVASSDYHLSFLDSFYNEANLFQRFIDKKRFSFLQDGLEQLQYEQDHSKREAWIDKIEAYLRDEHFIIHLYHPMINRVVDSAIQNTSFELWGYDDFRASWIEKNSP